MFLQARDDRFHPIMDLPTCQKMARSGAIKRREVDVSVSRASNSTVPVITLHVITTTTMDQLLREIRDGLDIDSRTELRLFCSAPEVRN